MTKFNHFKLPIFFFIHQAHQKTVSSTIKSMWLLARIRIVSIKHRVNPIQNRKRDIRVVHVPKVSKETGSCVKTLMRLKNIKISVYSLRGTVKV